MNGCALRAGGAIAAAIACAIALAVAWPAAAHPAADLRLEDLQARLAAEPRRADLLLQRGRLLAEAHDFEGARADLERALKLDPELVEADLVLARVHLGAGAPRRAGEAIDRFLGVRPADPAGLALRADVHRALVEPSDAAADYGRAIAAQKATGALPPPDWYLNRARLLAQARACGAADEALATLEQGLADLGRPSVLEWEALSVERGAGRIDAALRRADRMTGASASAAWRTAQGEILEAAGRPDEALAAYAAALDADLALPAPRRSAPAVARRVESLRAAIARLEAAR